MSSLEYIDLALTSLALPDLPPQRCKGGSRFTLQRSKEQLTIRPKMRDIRRNFRQHLNNPGKIKVIDIDLSQTNAYLKSSYQSWDLPGWHQRPPGLPAPSLLHVVGTRIGETQPPTGATGPAAHSVQMHHLVDGAVSVRSREREEVGKKERGSKLIQNVCHKVTQACLKETDLV